MTDETVSATTTISAAAATVFAVLADPSRHAALDGTGRVRDSLDGQRLTGPGQIFRVAMHHENHPDGNYEMANEVLAFEPPRVISWRPGYVSPGTGELEFGGWIWRYDLTQLGPDETEVILSYDWSAVGPVPRQHIQFPPFARDHLDNSLSHLAAIVAPQQPSRPWRRARHGPGPDLPRSEGASHRRV
jgi:uncharacterized protein YndB with AHSA1/START domain